MKANTHETDFAGSPALQRTSTFFINKKVWLPQAVYNSLPYFYLGAGIISLISTVHVGSWLWFIPHTILFAAVCIHIAILVFRKRHPAMLSFRPPRLDH